MTTITLPTPTEPVLDVKTGSMRPSWHRYFTNITRGTNAASTAIGGLAGSSTLRIPAIEQIESESVLITFADNAAYPLVINAPAAWTIDSVSTKCTTGTCTAAVSINGVALGGGTNAVSTTLVTVAHASANVLPVAGTLTLTLSANAAAEYVIVTLKIRRSFVVQS